MQSINELITRFWNGKSSATEEESLLKTLQETDAEIRAHHLEDFYEGMSDTDLPRISKSRRQRILKNVHKRIKNTAIDKRTDVQKINTEELQIFTMLIKVAAAVLLLILGSIITNKQFNSTPIGSTQSHAVNQTHSTTNSSDTVLSIVLSDKSTVHLAPEATIQHNSDFNGNHRNLTLHGKARFDVMENPDLPFNVTSRGFTVTALGTIFLIDASKADRLQVALLEGKVAVRNANVMQGHETEHILLPGEEFLIDMKTLRFDKFNTENGKLHKDAEMSNIDIPMRTQSGQKTTILHFDKTPISVVIDQLTVFYGKKIIYEPKTLNAQIFNGRLHLGDGTSISSLREVLSILLAESSLDFRIELDQISIIDKKTF